MFLENETRRLSTPPPSSRGLSAGRRWWGGRRWQGFTLLELLIALFIFTIVSMIMMGALHNIINTQTAAQKKSDRFAELETALLIISRDFEQTIDRPINNGVGIDPSLMGNKIAVEFTHAGLANPQGLLARSTLQRTRYEVKNNNLIRITWPTLDRTPETKPDQRVLLKSVTNFRVEYFDHTGHWQTDWPPHEQQKIATPRAVRITLTLQNWGTISQTYLIPGQPSEKKSS